MNANDIQTLKLLTRLWWLKKRRHGGKQDATVFIIFLILYIALCVGICVGFYVAGNPLEDDNLPTIIGLIIVAPFIIGDFIMKLIMKSDDAVMDDYIKSRPIPESLWVKFMLVSNVLSEINYIIPLLILPILIPLFSIPQTIFLFLTISMFSYTDSLFAICMRRTRDIFLKFMIIAGWIVMMGIISIYLVFSLWMEGWMQICGMMLLAIAVIAGLMAILKNEDNYDEARHKTTKQLSFGKVTLFTMQFYGVIRAKRLRNIVFISGIILILDAYLQVWALPDSDWVILYGIMAVVTPSIVLSQWTFGVEANFFQGLMSKPVTVERLLTNSFYFSMLLGIASALLMLPLTFMSDRFTLLMLLASLGISTLLNVFNLPTCLFSDRLELFSNSYFNVQGANMKINIYSLAMLLPYGIFVGLWFLCSPLLWAAITIGIGVAAFAMYRPVVRKVALKFEADKYRRMEQFMK